MSRLFSLQEAEEMLPTLERWLRSAVDCKKLAAQVDETMNALLLRINIFGGVQIDVDQVAEMKSTKQQALERLKQALTELENSGCLVKDLDMGLLDFPTLLDGAEVHLCWKLGEAHIGHWHHTSEGFQGRKSIDRNFLDRHKGGRPH